jgi:EAL domain-containing protein (putative c-di-GMP-specific phosphodiesterase class I)
VHYQPKVALTEGFGVIGVEALVRWNHPDRGLIAPVEFVPVADETGLMVPIGQYVLEQALSRIGRWRRHRPNMTVSVNLSARQLEDAGLVSMLAETIRDADLEPDVLCLEVTENALSRNRDRNLRTLDALKAIGLRLAIDNFGAGASSLTGLQQLPIDTLKIDRSIVGGIGRGPRERPILGAVVELGHALGLQVVAEGVETVAQLQALRDAECDAAQGYLLARPVPEDQVRSLLAEHDDCASPDRSCS